jgi:hypothetical protein
MAIIMRTLSIRKWLILLVCTLFAIFPNFLVYTNLLFYTLPVAFLLLLSTLFLQKFSVSGKTKYAHFFTSTAAAIMLTRSMYHLGWFVLGIAALLLFLQQPKKRILVRASILPVLVIVLLYAKNWMLVESAGPSSWLGMNLARGWALPAESLRKFDAFLHSGEIRELASEGKINPEWLVGPFMQPDAYKQLGYFSDQKDIHPALGKPQKANGFPNFNHADYAKISKKMLAANRAIILTYPGKYLRRMLLNLQLFLQPAAGPSWFLVQSYNYTNVEKYRRWMTLLFFQGGMIELAKGHVPLNTLYLLYPLLIFFGIKKGIGADENRAIYIFLTWSIVWVAVTTNMIEFGENNRIRFETDPLIAILFASAVSRGGSKNRPQKETTPSETS